MAHHRRLCSVSTPSLVPGSIGQHRIARRNLTLLSSITKEEQALYPDTDTNKPATPETGLCPDGCGTLPECAPLAVPYVPFQQTGPKRYNQAEALSNGTLFPGLNLPFHLKKDAPNAVTGPLGELQALEFVLLELGLYLDTHQADSEAFALYQQYAALEKAGREKYEAAHGPVIKTSVANQKDFSVWIKNPWPWDYMEGGSK